MYYGVLIMSERLAEKRIPVRRTGPVLAVLLSLSASFATPSQVLASADCGIFEGLRSKLELV